MDYSKLINELNEASLFDLYRLKTAINRELENPDRLKEIKYQLKEGDHISYFDETENRLVEAVIISIARTRIHVQNKHDGVKWTIPFYMINIDNVDTDIKPPNKGLDRNSLKVGDLVGFKDRNNNDLYGKVIKLNPKTATLLVDEKSKWRVSYSFLFPIIDGTSSTSSMNCLIECEVIK